jgi:predicted metal-binding membrane protein
MTMWMPTCGQTLAGTALSFIGMSTPMMAGMMLPVLAPALWRWRAIAGAAGKLRRAALASLVAAGYFAVWTVLGVLVLPAGAARCCSSPA